jgi:hypothetical protein
MVDLTNESRLEIMPLSMFLSLSPTPFQRDTEVRSQLSKVEKALSGETKREHIEVAIVELTDQIVINGKVYKKGQRFVSNGNTRAKFWRDGKSLTIPTKVKATIYPCKTLEEVQENYNMWDSPTAVEQNREKIFGYLYNIHNYEPRQKGKIRSGAFSSALGLASHAYAPNTFNTSASLKQVFSMIDLYIDEIKLFDQMCNHPQNWDPAKICAAFMSLKRYKNSPVNLKRLSDCIDMIDNKRNNMSESAWDGPTHIYYEYYSLPKERNFPKKSTAWTKPDGGGLVEVSSFNLHWMEMYIKDRKMKNLSGNWQNTVLEYFDNMNNQDVGLSEFLGIDEEKTEANV